MGLKKLVVLRKARKAVREFEWVTDHPMESQEAFVMKLARMNKDTLFGKRHSLDRVRSIDDYQRNVPVQDYLALKKYMKLIMEGERDVLFPGAPTWWAKTSGTTSEPKLIPVPRDMTKYSANGGSRLLYSFIMENPKKNVDVLSGKLFYLRAPSRLGEINGVPVGYSSGITGEAQSRFAKHMVVPTRETSELADWEEKFYASILGSVGENVTMVVGITSLLISMFKRMADEYPERLLQDLKDEWTKEKVRRALKKGEGRLLPMYCWENMRLFCPSGVSLRTYTSSFRDLFGEIPAREAYGATEGQFGHGDEENRGLLLNWDKYLFEFLPFDGSDRGRNDGEGETQETLSKMRRLAVAELKSGCTYEVLVTTPFGLYSYRIGDVLRLESMNPYRFTVVGRTKMTLSLFGEKICEEHVSTALREAEVVTRSTVSEYSCTVFKGGGTDPHYTIFVEFLKPPKDKTKFIAIWDKRLQEVAPVYGCLRANDTMLKPPKMVMVSRGTFQGFERRQMMNQHAIGQLKPPHIANSECLLSGLGVQTRGK